jgi:hypothetical protein
LILRDSKYLSRRAEIVTRRFAAALLPKPSILLGLAFIAASTITACSLATLIARPTGSSLRDPHCQSFNGETVEAVAWSSMGDFLAVSTSADADGEGRIRVFDWPGMDVVSEATPDVIAAYDAAIDDHGAVYWFSLDPVAFADVATRLWKLEPGGTPATIGRPVRNGAYVGLLWAGGSLVSMEDDPGPVERSRLVKLAIARPEAEPVGLTPWTTRLWSGFWADPSGEWLVWDEYDDAGEPQDFVVLHAGQKQVVRPPGYGGREMTLSPDRESLIYQRSETARLTVLNLKSGKIDRELSPIEFYGGVVSRSGILAALTAHGPGEPNQLCVLDVTAQL